MVIFHCYVSLPEGTRSDGKVLLDHLQNRFPPRHGPTTPHQIPQLTEQPVREIGEGSQLDGAAIGPQLGQKNVRNMWEYK